MSKSGYKPPQLAERNKWWVSTAHLLLSYGGHASFKVLACTSDCHKGCIKLCDTWYL